MNRSELDTPVAFIIFNRPEPTARVFECIAAARPSQLFVIADGPRLNRSLDPDLCAKTRAIIDQDDWPCKVVTNFAEKNLGCRDRVSSGLTWLFDQVPEAIILEDDCLPDPTFFPFCTEMLDRYRDDTRIGMICGDNFQFGAEVGDGSYYFSKYTHIWGWASWRRAWRLYDVKARTWPAFRASGCFERMTVACERSAWLSAFEGVNEGRIDTWDYQWTLACWAQSMLTVVPACNLITNIGFGPDATHTRGESRYANMPRTAIQWPLVAPSLVAADGHADSRTAKGMFAASLPRRLKRCVGRIVRSHRKRSQQ